MTESIALLRSERTVHEPCEIGTITEWLYVGDPTWDVSRPVISGSVEQLAESLREYAAMGVSHLQVRFPSRSADELVDQVRAFGTEVGPLLTR
jgi:alkanesulfonate monooxygenase SsuD/methylene tetrahydromethanopterin reductase-like flavin-dependent oxidoreductase (luciferase family)